jgi:hypothetical protein
LQADRQLKTKLSATATRALGYYGGLAHWQKARTIEVEADARGWAFILKGRPFFRKICISAKVNEPFLKLNPIGRDPGVTAVLSGHDVHLENAAGETIASRHAAVLG